MSSVHSLVTELSNLISQTKRRNVELRSAAEKSLEKLKTYKGDNEAVFLKNLSKDKSFIEPFPLACKTRNPKYSAIGVQCLHILINYRAIPEDELSQVVDGLFEASNLGTEIQIKILQSIVPLCQQYPDSLHGNLIAEVLQLCAKLIEKNKHHSVINSASATFAQVITLTFDKVATADRNDDPKSRTVQIEKGAVSITPAADDALKIFIDICALVERQPSKFLNIRDLPERLPLEVLESIIESPTLFERHEEFSYRLRVTAVPILLRFFTEKHDFPIFLRVTRMLYKLLCMHLDVLKVECEVILAVLLQCVENTSNPIWKRVLCMEVFKGVCHEFQLMKALYAEYDMHSDRRNTIKEMTETFEAIARENPDAIGYGGFSKPLIIPVGPDGERLEDVKIPPGLSDSTSQVRVLCLDMLDKGTPPSVPDSYLYFLVLKCVGSLADGFAKFAVPHQSSHAKSSVAQNAIQSETSLVASSPAPDNKQEVGAKDEDVLLVSDFLNKCHMDIVKILNTFFHATTDDDLFYNLIVKPAQTFGHASGALVLDKPRDAFAFLLGEMSCLIAQPSRSSLPARTGSPHGKLTQKGSVETVLNTMHQRAASITGLNMPGFEKEQPAKHVSSTVTASGGFTFRNMLCCRALLKLALTLGPDFDTSWRILLETLQQADSIQRPSSKQGVKTHQFRLTGEFSNADTVLRKVIESLKGYSANDMNSLLDIASQVSAQSLRLENSEEKGNSVGIATNEGDPSFIIKFIGELGQVAVLQFSPEFWKRFVDFLVRAMTERSVASEARIEAALVLNSTSYQAMVKSEREQGTQLLILESLKSVVDKLVSLGLPDDDSPSSLITTETEMHVGMIDNIVTIIEHCGGKLETGWKITLDIVETVFKWSDTPADFESDNPRAIDKSIRLIEGGFNAIQLVCSDFLESLPNKCLEQLVRLLYQFANQHRQLNASFSSFAFFWTLANHLRSIANDESDVVDNEMANITDRQNLEAAANGEGDASIHALWLLGLQKLTIIARNSHPQVRDGAVKTFFRILDAHGGKIPASVWHVVQTVVLPGIMDPKIQEYSSEWVTTLGLVTEGLARLFDEFTPIYLEQDSFEVQWGHLLKYFSALDANSRHFSPHASIHVYTSLTTILQTFLKENVTIPKSCLQDTWDFFTSRPITDKHYEVVEAKAQQDALTELAKAFRPLYDIDAEMSDKNLENSLEVLEFCASFAVLPPHYTDATHLSPLQSVALKQISHVALTTEKACKCVLNLAANLIRLHFDEHPSLPENAMYSRPTYITLCEKSLKLALEKLDLLGENFVSLATSNSAVSHLLESALVPLEKKFNCPILRIGDDAEHSVQLWQLATTVISETSKLMARSPSKKYPEELYRLILRGIIAVISTVDSSGLAPLETFEEFDLASYKTLLTTLSTLQLPQWFYPDLKKELYAHSRLYATSHIWVDTVNDASNIEGYTGTTTPCDALDRPKIAYMCIDELARLPDDGGEQSMYLDLRAANVIRRYITDKPLRGKMPMQSLLRKELLYTLKKHEGRNTSALHSLLVRAITVAYDDIEVLNLLQILL